VISSTLFFAEKVILSLLMISFIAGIIYYPARILEYIIILTILFVFLIMIKNDKEHEKVKKE